MISCSVSAGLGFYFYTQQTQTTPKPVSSKPAPAAPTPSRPTTAPAPAPTVTPTPAPPAPAVTPAPAPSAPAPAPLPNIKANNTDFCIDLPNGRTDFGTEAQIYTCNNTPAQQFAYDSASKLIRHIPSNRCLGNKDWRKDNGTRVDLVDCQFVNNRIQWERTGNSYKNVDSGKCLDVPNGDYKNTAPLTIYDCNNTPAQSFT
jgi:hypothetical protein